MTHTRLDVADHELSRILRAALDASNPPPTRLDVAVARRGGRRILARRAGAGVAVAVVVGVAGVGVLLGDWSGSDTTDGTQVATRRSAETFLSVADLMTAVRRGPDGGLAAMSVFLGDAVESTGIPTVDGLSFDAEAQGYDSPTWTVDVPLSDPADRLTLVVANGPATPLGRPPVPRDCEGLSDAETCETRILPDLSRMVTRTDTGPDPATGTPTYVSRTRIFLGGGGEILVEVRAAADASGVASRPAEVSEAQQISLARSVLRRP